MAYSVDLRERAVNGRVLKLTQKEAATRFQVGLSALKVWLKRADLTPDKPGPKTARLARKLLQVLVNEEPDLYLDEYAEKLGSKRSTVAYNLQVLNLSRKKTTLYVERNEEMRRLFEQELKTIEPASRVYVDECGLNEVITREYGRTVVGKRLYDNITGKRATLSSIIAGLNLKNPVAPMYFEGYCNTDVVKQWVKEALISVLKPGQMVIWDNARFHQCP